MIFRQYKNGSCDIVFSFKEKLIILRKGKIHLSDEALRHFGNTLVKMVADWNLKFNDDIKNLQTNLNTKIKIE
jgi:hypothetical protein